MKKLITFLFILTSSVFAQEKQDDIIQIESRILDKDTKEAIPYATIYKLRDGKGTISNSDGLFNLVNCYSNDSIRISFIGFETLFFIASDLKNKKTVYLKTKAEVLGQVNIYGEDTYLYELLNRSKKTTSNKILKAKTYFSLETYIDSSQVEWLEGYYNGEYQGYDMRGLKLKNTRVSLSSKRK